MEYGFTLSEIESLDSDWNFLFVQFTNFSILIRNYSELIHNLFLGILMYKAIVIKIPNFSFFNKIKNRINRVYRVYRIFSIEF